MKRHDSNSTARPLFRFTTLAGVVGLAVVAASSCSRASPSEVEVTRPAPLGEARPAAPPAAEPTISGTRLLGAIRDTAVRVARPHESLGLEGMANQMDPYLLGMIEMLRVVDRQAIARLRQALSDDTCGDARREELDLVLVAKLILLEPSLASPEALGCALQRHPEENFVLWSLLDAHEVAGRPPVPALAAIRRNAKDERTVRRLSSSREGRMARASPAARPESTRPGAARGER
jgi:hypothetical protein